MSKLKKDSFFKSDLLKLTFLVCTMIAVFSLFLVSPALSTPSLLSVVITMLISPWVARLERKSIPRIVAITAIFTLIGMTLFGITFYGMQQTILEWEEFRDSVPIYFQKTITQIQFYENTLKQRFTFLSSIQLTPTIIEWGKNTGTWFVNNGASIVGTLLSSLFIVPILSFVLLADGPEIRKRLFSLVPNRYFELLFIMSNKVLTSIADYLRAKLVEATIVGVLTYIGLAIVSAPYAIVLGILAGVTNIIPYLGPFIGAIPGLLIPALDPSTQNLLLPILIVYTAVNLFDNLVIFPVIVAKLVNLHPLILIAVVAVGGQYYGLIGMLISIPIATTFKVIISEIYYAVYEKTPEV